MSAREEMLATIRAHQPAPVELPDLPSFADAGVPAGTTLLDAFVAGLERMGARFAGAPPDGDVAELVASLFPNAAVFCSAVPEVAGNRPLAQVRRPAELHDVDVGVVRAAFGVAETGSVYVTDREFGVNSLGFLAQHLVVLLDPARIVPNMHAAYREPAVARAGYGVFMTGPSATADIEGVLIHGAQGIRSLTVVAAPA
ncbi:MAG: LUD domain-containing protein [Burkholderiales bacterium]